MERDISDDAVALVEDREDGDALGHRSYASDRGRPATGPFRRNLILLLAATAASRKRDPDQQGCGEQSHAYSGIHGS